jgi:hypothetical protein
MFVEKICRVLDRQHHCQSCILHEGLQRIPTLPHQWGAVRPMNRGIDITVTNPYDCTRIRQIEGPSAVTRIDHDVSEEQVGYLWNLEPWWSTWSLYLDPCEATASDETMPRWVTIVGTSRG